MSSDTKEIKVVAPSALVAGEEFSLGIKVLTEPYRAKSGCYGPMPSPVGRYNESSRGTRYMDNVAPSFTETVEIDGGDGYRGPAILDFSQGSGPCAGDKRPIRRINGLKFSTPGIKRIKVTCPKTGASGVSNTISVTKDAPALRLFWGDIHCHSFLTDGLRCPEEIHAFARHEAFLDIFSLSDHSESLSERQWEYFTAVANDNYEKGAFVTLQGLEWTSKIFGHRNVYYPGDGGPCIRCKDPAQKELSVVYDIAKKHGAIVIPHHTSNARMGVDWSLGFDADVERLVEIYSTWGNSERSAASGNTRPIRNHGGEVNGRHLVDGLALGRRYGFIGSGDIHDGRPGDDLHIFQEKPDQYKNLYRQGIMGVWAKELTRESVFEAMYNRRVYGTTGARIQLRFSIDGKPMGSEIPAAKSLAAKVEVLSESPVSRIDLVCDGKDTETAEPHKSEVDWNIKIAGAASGRYYYARVIREDGEMAWSSPIWIS